MAVTWPTGARQFVHDARVARLATSAANNTPHVIPICFTVSGDRVYSVVDAKPKRDPVRLKRLRNIAENPSVAVVVDLYDDDWSRLEWVLMQGRALLVADKEEYDNALASLRARYRQYRTMDLELMSNPMIRIEIARVTSWAHGSAEN